MNNLQWTTFYRHSFKTIQCIIEQFLQNRSLFIVMIALQLLWLAGIAWTGTSTNWSKLWFLSVYSVIAGTSIIFLPTTFILKLRIFKGWLLYKEIRLYIFLFLIAVIAGAFYAYSQQVWGDESRSYTVAQVIATEGVETSYLSSGWLRNKHPPLMPLMYGFIINLLGANLFYMRLVTVAFLAATTVITYLIGRQLYDRDTGYLASFLLLSFPLVIRLGSSAMMDMQLTFFFSLALLLSLRLLQNPSYWFSGVIGIVIGIGLLTKYTMALIFGVLFCIAIISLHFRRIKLHLAIAVLVSVSLFAGWLFYANHIGILSGQIQKISEYSGIYHLIKISWMKIQPGIPESYTASPEYSGNPLVNGIRQLGLESLVTRIPSSLGVHHSPLILYGGIYLLRRRRPSDWFILIWIGIVFIFLFLTLPDHRYFLPTFPAIAILIARSLHRFPEYTERVILLCLLFGGGALYLFVDWVREAHLFPLR